MRYWRERSQNTGEWEYKVEYFGITSLFSEPEDLLRIRDSLKESRWALAWHRISTRIRSFTEPGGLSFTLYVFKNRKTIFYYIPFGGNILYFRDYTYVNLRYHPQIRAFLYEAYLELKKEKD